MNCLAPLPEDLADTQLTGLLVPAPHVVPEKKAKKKAMGTQKSSRRLVVSDSSPDDPEAPSASEDNEEEEEASPPPAGGGTKGRPPRLGRPEGPRRGRPFFRTTPPTLKMAEKNGHPGSSPWRNRKCLVTRMTHGAPLLFDNVLH